MFETFGFDKFITKDEMKFKGRGGGRFIDDESAYNEVRHQIDTHDQPVLAHLITMQNHMPFGGQYDDPIKPTGLPPSTPTSLASTPAASPQRRRARRHVRRS